MYKGYILIDPITNIPRYVGITKRTLKQRFIGHLHDVKKRPNLNPHKTNWFNKLQKYNLKPIIQLIQEFETLDDAKQFEVDYIKKYKDSFKLINLTPGGDYIAYNAHSREAILKRHNTRSIIQYNVLGEKIAEYPIIEDAVRALGLRDKAGSHITGCCKGNRNNAYGYIWRYKGDNREINGDVYSIRYNNFELIDPNNQIVGIYNNTKTIQKIIGVKSKGNIYSLIRKEYNSLKGFKINIVPKYIYYDENLLKEKLYNYSNVYKNHNKSYYIDQLDLNGNYLKTYRSASEASYSLYGTKNYRKHIRDCCKGLKEYYNIYKWRYSLNSTNSEDEQIVNSELTE